MCVYLHAAIADNWASDLTPRPASALQHVESNR
jgi:hypothetical protein